MERRIKVSVDYATAERQAPPANAVRFRLIKPKHLRKVHDQTRQRALRAPDKATRAVAPQWFQAAFGETEAYRNSAPLAYRTQRRRVVDRVEKKLCAKCGASGKVEQKTIHTDYKRCLSCGGQGVHWRRRYVPQPGTTGGYYTQDPVMCTACGASGLIPQRRTVTQTVSCPKCRGSGQIEHTHYKWVKLTILYSVRTRVRATDRLRADRRLQRFSKRVWGASEAPDRLARFASGSELQQKTRRASLILRYRAEVPIHTTVVSENARPLGRLTSIGTPAAALTVADAPFLDRRLAAKTRELKRLSAEAVLMEAQRNRLVASLCELARSGRRPDPDSFLRLFSQKQLNKTVQTISKRLRPKGGVLRRLFRRKR
ncbi:MAG: hypothetical protein RIB45_10720 [Marivibrio sp.]